MAELATMELENPERKKVLGILNLKKLKDSLKNAYNQVKSGIETKIDENQTKRAENKYDIVRDKLVYAWTNYSKDQYDEYIQLAEDSKNMTPVEYRKHVMSIMKAKKKAATIGVASAAGAATWTLGDTICAALTTKVAEDGAIIAGQGIINTTLAAFGIAGLPWTTLVSVAMGVSGFAIAMRGLKKSQKGKIAEQELSRNDFVKEIEKLAKDILVLKNTLEQSREEWVQKAKTMKTKDYKKAYAAFVEETVTRLNLEHIDTWAIRQVFGKGEDVEKQADDKTSKKGKKSSNLTDEQRKTIEEQISEGVERGE